MESLESILSTTDVFADEKYLRIGYRPQSISEIKHRDNVVRQYLATLRDLTNGNVPPNMLIFGKSGSGKTMITNVILDELKKYVTPRGINVDYVSISCDCTRTDSKIMKEIIAELETTTGATHPKIANDLGEYYDWFCQLVEMHQGILIIVLDEIDKMKNPNLINTFCRIVENGTSTQNICVIGITNDTEFTAKLNAKTISALAQSQIVFPPYDADQLADILTDRATKAFNQNVLEESVIPLCAALAAQEHGDARKAIALLHAAGINARELMKSTVTEDDVYQARNKADLKNTYVLLRTLPIQQKILLLACTALEKTAKCEPHTTDIYSTYTQICGFLKRDPLSQRRISELIEELAENGFVTTTTYSMGRNGLKKKVKCSTVSNIIDLLLEDDEFDNIDQITKCIPPHLLKTNTMR